MVQNILSLNGEYVVCWDDVKNILIGPEQVHGDLFTHLNVYFNESLENVQQYIADNGLIENN